MPPRSTGGSYSFELVEWVKVVGVLLFFLALMSVCCFYRYKHMDDVVPATPWTDRANHYIVRAKGRTDKRIYLRYENGLWIHCTHSTT